MGKKTATNLTPDPHGYGAIDCSTRCNQNPLSHSNIYQHRFTSHHPYANSLARLGHFYRLYERLMADWRAVLPLTVHEVRYETMIDDPEVHGMALIDFLGLEWDRRCLEFHKTERTVRTASAWEVRQPLYKSSVGRWQNYDAHLGELKEALAGA